MLGTFYWHTGMRPVWHLLVLKFYFIFHSIICTAKERAGHLYFYRKWAKFPKISKIRLRLHKIIVQGSKYWFLHSSTKRFDHKTDFRTKNTKNLQTMRKIVFFLYSLRVEGILSPLWYFYLKSVSKIMALIANLFTISRGG